MEEVRITPRDPAQLAEVIGHDRFAEFRRTVIEPAGPLLAGRSVVNVNSTASGGGVAELLTVLLAYTRGAGIDCRWLVIDGDPEFFTITKRLHHHLYGGPGDGGPLGAAEHAHYEEVMRRNAAEIALAVRPGDVVLLHDPQPAGLAATLRQRGAKVVWRCHVGVDTPNDCTREAWSFLERYVHPGVIDAYVFSRAAFVPEFVPRERTVVISPSIDPFSPKNAPMGDAQVVAILQAVGLVAGAPAGPATFARDNGTPGRVQRGCDVIRCGPAPPPDAPMVVQVSRWDPLKDMAGVMRGFADLAVADHGSHLVLAGPVVTAVADDPEQVAVFEECARQWRALPHAARERVTLACVPMADPDENAAIVSALQHHAAVVVQKSLAEGFGLTVVEALYKRRAVVASAVGGIVDQIVDGESGVLLADPTDLGAFTATLSELLADEARRHRLGEAGHTRVVERFLPDRHLRQWWQVLAGLLVGR